MSITSFIRFDSLINILIPRACLLCRRPTREPHHLCQPCARELPILSHSCRKCAQFLHSSERRQLICGQCLSEPPPYDTVFTLFPYDPPLPKLIAGLKFEHQFSIASLFSHFLAHAVQAQWYIHQKVPDLILPMPLHPRRQRERGYNQAHEAAKPASRMLGIPLDLNLVRIKPTLPQSTLPASKRRQNTANAFAVTRSYAGLHVALFDDVMTTGCTVSAAARVLQKHGAKRVDIWCIARSSR